MEQKTSLKEIARLLLDPAFDRILVACHRTPDGDAAGSSHALAYALRKLGKQARVFCPDPFGEEFSYITKAEEDLPPFSAERFITVDVASPKMLPDAPFLDRVDLVLDHHRISTLPGKIRWICPERASCGEIVLDLLREMEVPFDSYLALALYTAVATDTGCFRYSNTNENTFLAAAFLSHFVPEGAFYRINKALFETKSRLRLSLESFASSRMKLAAEGKIAYLSISRKTQAELRARYEDLDPLINVIRQLAGVVVSLVVKEREEGVFKVSVRSEEGFDASEFCCVFGGGGHKAAAGCDLCGTEEEVVRKLLAEAVGRIS